MKKVKSGRLEERFLNYVLKSFFIIFGNSLPMVTAMMFCRNNQWSEGLSLQAGSSTVIRLTSGAQELALIVSLKRLSSTVCQVCIYFSTVLETPKCQVKSIDN